MLLLIPTYTYVVNQPTNRLTSRGNVAWPSLERTAELRKACILRCWTNCVSGTVCQPNSNLHLLFQLTLANLDWFSPIFFFSFSMSWYVAYAGMQRSWPPQHFHWPPILDRTFNMGGQLHCKYKCFSVFSLKSRLFQDFPFNYTPNWTIWSSKFQKNSGEGSRTEPPPQTPPPLFFGLRPRFGLRPIRTPQLLKRSCALDIATPSSFGCVDDR